MKVLLSLLASILAVGATAQMPDTDVWLFKLKQDKGGDLLLEEGNNITNRKGYDNQVYFSVDGKTLFYSSVREDGQADVYAIDCKSKKIKQVTKTLESEYSPTPFFDQPLLSTVVVEKDSSQHIHLLNAETGATAAILPFDSVGYSCFVNQDTVVYFKLTEPQSLRYHVRSSGENRLIAYSPTRSILRKDRHSIIYASKDSSSTSFYTYDFLLRKSILICKVKGSAEDAYYTPSHELLRSDGSKILKYDVTTKDWKLLYDLALFGIKQIARFKLDAEHKQLAVVQVNEAK